MTSSLKAPGFPRAFLFLFIGIAFAFALVIGIRSLYGWDDVVDQNGILMVALLGAPLFWLVGLGAFDYWVRYAIGSPTRPEDHADHGAHSWKDYFRVNPDHKVIGIQYTVASFVFFFKPPKKARLLLMNMCSK